MKEYMFTDADVVVDDVQSTSNKSDAECLTDLSEQHLANIYFWLQTIKDEELPVQDNSAGNDGLHIIDSFLRCHNDGSEVADKQAMPFQCAFKQDFPSSAEAPKRLELSTSSNMLLRRLRERKINLILVATSLDENDIVKKLESTLDPKVCKTIPLSFKDIGTEHSCDFTLGEVESNSYLQCTRSENDKDKTKDNSAQVSKWVSEKPKRKKSKDEKYWKRRNSNNEAAKRSRDAKKARFSWIEDRTRELALENARLADQLKTLQSKMAQMESSVALLN